MAEYKKLIINALLAGFWAGLAAFQATGELSKAALLSAGAVALRAVIGVLSAHFGHSVPVDK